MPQHTRLENHNEGTIENDGLGNLVESLQSRPKDYWDIAANNSVALEANTQSFLISDLHQILTNLDSANKIEEKDLKRLEDILIQLEIPKEIIKGIVAEFSQERDQKSWAIYTDWLHRNEAIELGTAERQLGEFNSNTHINRLLSELGAKYTLSKLTRVEQNRTLLDQIFSVEKATFTPQDRQAVVAIRGFYRDLIFGSSDCAKATRDLLLGASDQRISQPQQMLLKGVMSAFFEHTDRSKIARNVPAGWNQLTSRGITQTELHFLRFYSKGTHTFIASFNEPGTIGTKPKPLLGSNLTKQSKESLLIYLSSVLTEEDKLFYDSKPFTKIKQFIQNTWNRLLFGRHAPSAVNDPTVFNRYHSELASSPEFLEHEMIRHRFKEIGGGVYQTGNDKDKIFPG